MKHASHNPSDEYFVLKMDGHLKSTHRRFIDALKAALELKKINFQRTTSKGHTEAPPKDSPRPAVARLCGSPDSRVMRALSKAGDLSVNVQLTTVEPWKWPTRYVTSAH